MSINLTCLGANIDSVMRGLTELFLRGRLPADEHLRIKTTAKQVNTGHWQSLTDVPQTETIELQNVHVTFNPPSRQSRINGVEAYFKPNLPWASDHFVERVSGKPLNPGYEYRNWPWYRNNVEEHKKPGQFSHTYMERFWPRWAAGGRESDVGLEEREGVRYRYGDLNDLLDLLVREPYTRQAYLPIFFPEDTGAYHGERVPCTLGYHFMMRDDRLHIFYPIRSMDFMRYTRDDLYMTARLGIWIITQLQAREQKKFEEGESPDMLTWDKVKLGELNLFASSLHIFPGDLPALQRNRMPIMRGWEDD